MKKYANGGGGGGRWKYDERDFSFVGLDKEMLDLYKGGGDARRSICDEDRAVLERALAGEQRPRPLLAAE